MIIKLTEPVAPRYIHINPQTNHVHVLVPLVGGQEIGTDNTCKALVAITEFFDGAAIRELNAYKEALIFDQIKLDMYIFSTIFRGNGL